MCDPLEHFYNEANTGGFTVIMCETCCEMVPDENHPDCWKRVKHIKSCIECDDNSGYIAYHSHTYPWVRARR